MVLGTSGEFPSFSVAERKLVTETAMKHKGNMNIMVGPGTPNIVETIDLAKHAQSVGADGLLVIPPFYFNNPPVEGLTRHYAGLFEAAAVLTDFPERAVDALLGVQGRLVQYPLWRAAA